MKWLLIFYSLVIVAACASQDQKETEESPKIVFICITTINDVEGTAQTVCAQGVVLPKKFHDSFIITPPTQDYPPLPHIDSSLLKGLTF